ncbi:MAG TPA: phytoene desaturase family protein [Bacteroidia bacterium]|nr:phytoene desaturase family protein [Bacteroidia bacterium]
MSKIVVIGSGFSGLAAGAYLAKGGHTVQVLEKNADIGGRARIMEREGFLFDMGPSWYWMPDAFERFFESFGKKVSDLYELKKLDPGFQVIFGPGEIIPVPAEKNALRALFERIEPGSAAKLDAFLEEGRFKYAVGMQKLAHYPALSWLEFANYDVISGALRSHIFRSMKSYVRRFFKDPRLVAIMEFPVLFLGAKPSNIPALYSLMNYAALELGTFYPMGGMHRIIDAMKNTALEAGVKIETNCNVEKIVVQQRKVNGVNTSSGLIACDALIASGDYHHTEQQLLDVQYRNYSTEYWGKKTMAPSSLIFYLGISRKIGKLIHHNLFFDRDFDRHSEEIYDRPSWPKEPLFYVCCPSKTDPSVAPQGSENLFVLIPIAPGLEDTAEIREHYYQLIMDRMEKTCGESIRDYVVFKQSYCIKDFINDYNAFKGNAYGLANTLSQTAVLKPSVRNRHLRNLHYAGQLTVPGPGVPPALISGKIAAQQTMNYLKKIKS